jgi:hypothetical protein
MEHHTELPSKVRLLAFPANTRLEWKGPTVAIALAYYDTVIITAVKICILRAPDD